MRDAVKFWERKRLIYNAVLACIVLAGFILAWPKSADWFSRPALRTLVEAALLANVAYCAAYAVELLFHITGYRKNWQRESWQRWRVALLMVGGLIASWVAIIIVGVLSIGSLSN